MKVKPFFLGVFICLLAFSNSSYGFKAGSHVWIAQQIINDLQDGKIDIEVSGTKKTFDVDPSVVQAILTNQKIYRQGHIGPDAGPDIYVLFPKLP